MNPVFVTMNAEEVAPPVGAWIEMKHQTKRCILRSVAPPVGAWIEIIENGGHATDPKGSLPPWERGLKYVDRAIVLSENQSLPPWERGLKFAFCPDTTSQSHVAPPVGAWIEIPPPG